MNTRFKQLSLRLSLALLASLTALSLSGCGGSKSGGTGSYSQIVVFGASLSDNGNAVSIVPGLFPGAPYYPGRASNGLLWIDLVAAATVGNNIFAVINNGLPGSVVTTEAPADIASIMNRLYNAGARKFLVTNVPDVGATPRGRELPSPATATALSNGFNGSLNNELANFRASHAGADVRLADFKSAVAITAGFTNTTDPCVVNLVACATPDTYTYWDNLHPTAATGRIWQKRHWLCFDSCLKYYKFNSTLGNKYAD